MNSSVKQIKDQLRRFLAGESQEFPVWFAIKLRDVHIEDPEAESLAHEIQRVFSDAKSGRYDATAAREELARLGTDHGWSENNVSVYFRLCDRVENEAANGLHPGDGL